MKQFTVKKILCSKEFGQNFFKSEKFWVYEIGSQKILGLKHFCVKKNFGVKKLRPPKNWVKILSATAELFMIWEKVVRTNIACTNVTVTFGIC